ncbi:MAG: hypothetical protein AAGJ11_19150 [Bacteroidota bacterium]
MRALSLLLVLFVLALPSQAQDALPDCASLLSEAEVRTTCGVADAAVTVDAGRTSCQISAQRPGTASMMTVVASVQDSPEAARATVEMAGVIGQAGEGQTALGEGNAAMGQVAEMLGIQSPDAPEAADVSDEEAAFRALPDLGDGGVRYVTDLSGALGAATHTVLFAHGALVVKLESAIVADRAGVCTADGLETLARRVASRL